MSTTIPTLPEQITSWSITGLLEFEQCPHRAYLRRIRKAPMPELEENHPMIRGRKIHQELEDYISGKEKDFPASGKKLRDEIDFVKEQFDIGAASVEEKWGFTEDWDSVGWFEDTTWCRMATDACVTFDDALIIYDWKTGKSFGNEVKYMQQMQLYAIGGFMRTPDAAAIDVHLGFVDDGKLRSKSFYRDTKTNRLLAKFTERAERMTSCVDFRPKPSVVNCKWCPFGPNGTKACVYGAEPL